MSETVKTFYPSRMVVGVGVAIIAAILWWVATGAIALPFSVTAIPVALLTYVQASARIEVGEATLTHRNLFHTVTLDAREPVELMPTGTDSEPDFFLTQGDRRVRINEGVCRDSHLLFAEIQRLWPTLPRLHLLSDRPPRGPFK